MVLTNPWSGRALKVTIGNQKFITEPLENVVALTAADDWLSKERMTWPLFILQWRQKQMDGMQVYTLQTLDKVCNGDAVGITHGKLQ